MARPVYAARRALSRSGQLAAFGAVVLLISAALAVICAAIGPLLDAGARQLVTQAGPTASAMRVEARLADDAEAQDARVRDTFSAALDGLPATIIRTVSGEAEGTAGGAAVTLQLLADPSVGEAANLVQGDWPSSADETAVQDAAAAALRLSPGDVVTVGSRTLRVSGIWRATDPAAARWFGDPAVASGIENPARGPVLADESVLAELPDAPTVRWTMIPAASSLGVSDLPRWAEALVRLDTAVDRLNRDSAVRLSGDLPETLARASRVTAVDGGVLALPIVLVTVVGVIVLSLIARAIASGRGAEFMLLRARGASARAVSAASAREAAVVAVAGAALGGALAWVALQAVLLAGADATDTTVVLAGIPVAVAVVATATSWAVTVAELRAPVTGRTDTGRGALAASLGPLILAGIAAGLALAQFLSLGSPVVVRADGVIRTDPVAVSAPVLVLLAACLAAPVIAGPVVALSERAARAGRGILPVLPLRQLARRSRAVAAGVLVIALAAGSVVLALQFRVSANQARQVAEQAATGASLRVTVPVGTSVDDGAPGASSAVLDGVAGVDAAFAVLSTTASVGPDPIPFVAAPVGPLASAPSSSPGFAALAPALTDGGIAADLPAGAAELTASFQVSTGGKVPADLRADVVVWFSDRDGAALRVPAGVIPLVAGAQEVSVPIPAAAVDLLAVDLRPPALDPDAVVTVGLGGVQASGEPVAWQGQTSATLVGSTVQRFLPRPPPTGAMPVVVGDALAARLGLGPGSTFAFRVGTIAAPVSAQVAGVLASLPGQSGSLGIVADLTALEQRALALGGSVPAANQLWVVSPIPDAAVASVRAALDVRAEVVSPRMVSSTPVLDPAIDLLLAGVLVTALLAVLGFAAVAASVAQRRRAELTPLRSLGLSAARIRAARAIELLATALIALLLGAAAGWLTAVLVVPGLTEVLR
ncbi:MAG TPA: FtsX-like permease family protein [Pseudolysinimonas sp.]|nr:FtsX-like permease family protein [Pseudolysinimonas sp.]